MGFRDKLTDLRKKKGWSQEELAERLDVSRQSVSKWESGQATPDVERIIKLSRIFGVSTDYLLKDEEVCYEEMCESGSDNSGDRCGERGLSEREADSFISYRRDNALRLALGVLLCCISPIALLFLIAMGMNGAEVNQIIAVTLGIFALLVIVAVAVCLFILYGIKGGAFSHITQGNFFADSALKSRIKDEMESFRHTYARFNIIGIALCIISPAPIIFGSFISERAALFGVCATLTMVGFGVLLLVKVGTVWGGYQAILKEGDYSDKAKQNEGFASVFWLVTLAIYLAWSFIFESWGISWVIWPVAAVIFAAACAVIDLVKKNKR